MEKLPKNILQKQKQQTDQEVAIQRQIIKEQNLLSELWEQLQSE